MDKLLTRQEFKEKVFKRDKHTCVFCSLPAVDAHHIYDRKLWNDGGYYLNNGASVCEKHHWSCEKTDISVEEVLVACKITSRMLPPSLQKGYVYDKWGNIILPDGTRKCGPMIENTLSILEDKLHLFID